MEKGQEEIEGKGPPTGILLNGTRQQGIEGTVRNFPKIQAKIRRNGSKEGVGQESMAAGGAKATGRGKEEEQGGTRDVVIRDPIKSDILMRKRKGWEFGTSGTHPFLT